MKQNIDECLNKNLRQVINYLRGIETNRSGSYEQSSDFKGTICRLGKQKERLYFFVVVAVHSTDEIDGKPRLYNQLQNIFHYTSTVNRCSFSERQHRQQVDGKHVVWGFVCCK